MSCKFDGGGTPPSDENHITCRVTERGNMTQGLTAVTGGEEHRQKRSGRKTNVGRFELPARKRGHHATKDFNETT